MKRIVFLAFCSIIIFGLSGCIQTDTLIKVNKDGSGTIQMKQLISKAAMEGAQTGDVPLSILDEENLKASASDMGQQVSYVSGKDISNDKFVGYIATYKFKDVRKIMVDQNPSGGMESPEDKEAAQDHEYIKFGFKKKGKKSILTILMPKDKKADEKNGGKEAPGNDAHVPMDPQQEAMQRDMMKQMFADMYIGYSVEVNGKVVKSDASYRKGSLITLMEMDFNKIISDDKKFKAFMDMGAQSMEDAKKLMKDIPGLKSELKDKVTVVFK